MCLEYQVPSRKAPKDGPFVRSNLRISKSTNGLAKLFSQGRIDDKQIYRSPNRDEVKIPVRVGLNGAARDFVIHLKPISNNLCHFKLVEKFPNKVQDQGGKTQIAYESKTVLKDASIAHLIQEPRVSDEDNFFVSHLRREIEGLTQKSKLEQSPKIVAEQTRERARDIARPNLEISSSGTAKSPIQVIKSAGLTIEGLSEKVANFLSSPDLEVKTKGNRNDPLTKLVKITDQSAIDLGRTLKFNLSKPDGNNQAKVTVSDKSGNVLLRNSTIRVERSTREQDQNPAVKALSKAVTRMNKKFNALIA